MRIKIVPYTIRILQLEMAIAIGQRPGIAPRQQIEAGLKPQLMQVGTKITFLVVVVNLALFEQQMTNAKIKHSNRTGCAAGFVFRCGQVGVALPVGKDSDHRMLNSNVAQVPGFVQPRRDRHCKMHRVGREQRWIGVGSGSMHDYSVHIDCGAQAGPMEVEVPHLYLASQGFTGFLLRSSPEVDMETITVQKQADGDHGQHYESREGSGNPYRNPLPPFAT